MRPWTLFRVPAMQNSPHEQPDLKNVKAGLDSMLRMCADALVLHHQVRDTSALESARRLAAEVGAIAREHNADHSMSRWLLDACASSVKESGHDVEPETLLALVLPDTRAPNVEKVEAIPPVRIRTLGNVARLASMMVDFGIKPKK